MADQKECSMKTIVIGDIHGRDVWKKIVEHENADKVIFMDEGKIIEMQKTKDFFEKPQSDRTKLFLSQILR